VKVGDIVRARHWHRGEVGVVVNIGRLRVVTVKIITPDGIWEIDQLASDLEGDSMKIGDLAEHYTEPQCWGIIVAIQTFEYEIYWMDGDRTWIRKTSVVKKCP